MIRVSAVETLRRFPFVLLAAAFAFVNSLVLTHAHRLASVEEWAIRIIMPAVLALSVALAISLVVERYALTFAKRCGLIAGGMVVLVIFGFSYQWLSIAIYSYRFWHLMVAAHLFVSLAFFFRAENHRGFWSFNRSLFQRLVLSFFYSLTLYVGLCIALSAIDHLLGIKINHRVYTDLWLFLFFIFNTWFFIAGIPRDVQALERDDSFPNGLKVFVQFVLIPLLLCYIVILYLYLGKILFIRAWPKGTIGWLVSVVSVLGTFCWLLLHPLRARPGYGWIRFYAKVYFQALIPLLVLLLMAIWRRVGEYGVTVDRYLLLILCLWMMAIALWYIFRSDSDIRIVPCSLALVAILTAFGPWSSFAVSQRSQTHRLHQALENAGLLKNGQLQAATAPVPWADRKKISGSLDYLLSMYGVQSLRPTFNNFVKEIPKESQSPRPAFFLERLNRGLEGSPQIMKALNMEYASRWEQNQKSPNLYFSYNVGYGGYPIELIPTEQFRHVTYFSTPTNTAKFVVEKSTYTVVLKSSEIVLEVTKNEKTISKTSLKPYLSQLFSQSSVQKLPPFYVDQAGIRLKLYPQSLSGVKDEKGLPQTLSELRALMLLDF